MEACSKMPIWRHEMVVRQQPMATGFGSPCWSLWAGCFSSGQKSCDSEFSNLAVVTNIDIIIIVDLWFAI